MDSVKNDGKTSTNNHRLTTMLNWLIAAGVCGIIILWGIKIISLVLMSTIAFAVLCLGAFTDSSVMIIKRTPILPFMITSVMVMIFAGVELSTVITSGSISPITILTSAAGMSLYLSMMMLKKKDHVALNIMQACILACLVILLIIAP